MIRLIVLLFLSATNIPSTQPGGTVTLTSGLYSPARITSPCTIRSVEKWGARIHGASAHGIEVRASNVTLEGLRITGSIGQAVKVYAPSCTIRDCWVSFNELGGILGTSTNLTIDRCWIERNGRHPRLDHGIYASGTVTITNCVIDHNAACGIHLYPQATECYVIGNRVTDHSLYGILICSRNPYAVGTMVSGNQIAGSPVGIEIYGDPTLTPHRLTGNLISCDKATEQSYGKPWVEEINTTTGKVDRPLPGTIAGGWLDPFASSNK